MGEPQAGVASDPVGERRQVRDAQREQAAALVEVRQTAGLPALLTHLLQSAHATGRLRPLVARQALAMQGSLGNQYVQRVFQSAAVRREEAAAEAPEAGEADSDLDALLDQLGLHRHAPEIPAFEAITATTSAEFSRGELETQIQELWRREHLAFTAAARRSARENAATAHGGARATQSPTLAPTTGGYAKRWAVSLLASDYPRWGELPDVARLMRRGSPFRASLEGEFARVIPVENPTASQMRSQIFDATMAMWMALGEGQAGELVVTFSGHGGGGDICGVDGECLGPQELRSAAQMARDFNVHIIYVIDTCRADRIAQLAQSQAFRDLQARLPALPGQQQVGVQARFEVVRTLGRASMAIADSALALGDMLRSNRRNWERNFLQVFHEMGALHERASEVSEGIRAGRLAIPGLPDMTPIQEAYGRYQIASLAALAADRSAVKKLLRRVAELLDATHDVVNDAISLLDAETRGAGAGPGAGAAGSAAQPAGGH